VDVAGQRLQIGYAVDAAIDQELTERPEAIADAQFAFAERLFSEPRDEASKAPGLQTDTSLYSATSDGSIFSVNVE
jgi:hypothetical protein